MFGFDARIGKDSRTGLGFVTLERLDDRLYHVFSPDQARTFANEIIALANRVDGIDKRRMAAIRKKQQLEKEKANDK